MGMMERNAELHPAAEFSMAADLPAIAGGKGWVALQYLRGAMDVRQLLAAADIVRALASRGCAASPQLRALDYAKLRVDGGPAARARTPAGLRLRCEGPAERWAAYRRHIADREPPRGVIKGRHETMDLGDVIEGVLTGLWSPRGLDRTLGVRDGRVSEAVLRELAWYADINILT